MLQYVMTKLETHNINSDGQIMPGHHVIDHVSILDLFSSFSEFLNVSTSVTDDISDLLP